MAVNFHPKAGQVLICNFETGFIPPEMVKIRRVIIISPSRINTQLCRVVPLSTTPPNIELRHHCRFEPASYSFLHKTLPTWAKGDMVTCVSLHRLDRLRIGNQFITPSISSVDFQRVISAVMSGISQGLTENA